MSRATYDAVVARHGEAGAIFVQELSRIQRTSLITRRATIAKALLNAFYKGILAEAWIKHPFKTLETIEKKADAYPKDYKVSLRRPDTGKELGPGNWYLQGVKPNDSQSA